MKVCDVCGYENLNRTTQCHKCCSTFDNRPWWKVTLSHIRIFKRILSLELKTRKLEAAFIKISREIIQK